MTDPKLNIKITADLTAIRSTLSQLSKDVSGLGTQLAKNSDQGARSLSKLEGAAVNVKRTIVGLATSFAAMQAIKGTFSLADQFLQLNGVLTLATKTSEEFLIAQKGVFDIAQRTRAPVKETADTYATLERTTKTLGLSQGELLRTLETVNKAIGLTPVSAQAAQAALVQFGQALGGDFKAGAQELNSILEQTPGLAISIAKGLGVETTALKKLGEEGKLSAELVVRGLLRISEEVDEKFSKVPRTISGALTQLKNDLVFTIGRTDLSPLLTSLDEFRAIITDPNVVAGLAAIASGIVKIAAAAAGGISDLANFAKFIGETFAAAAHGPAADDLVRLSDRIIRLRERLKEMEGTATSKWALAGHIRKTREELEGLERTLADSQRAAEEAAAAAVRKVTADKDAIDAARKKARADLDAAVAAREKKAADEAAAKEAEKRQKAIRNLIDDLKEEAATHGKSVEETIRYKLAILGATQAQMAAAIAAAQRIDQLKAEEEAQKKATRETEKRKEAEERLAVALEDARARMSLAEGNTFAVAQRKLEKERDQLLEQIAEGGGTEADKALVNRLFNVELARERAQDIERQAADLLNKLRQLEDNFALQDQAGASGMLEREQQLIEMRAKTIQQLEELRLKLQEVFETSQDAASRNAAADALGELDNQILRVKATADTVKNDIKDLGQSSLENFFNNIASGSMKAGDAFKQLVVDFLQGLARMASAALSKRIIFGATGDSGLMAGVFHGGGIAGNGGARRWVNPAIFAGAPRYHGGGVAGLAPNEVPAVLKKGEEVLTEGDPRHVNNGGQQRPAPGFRVVNVFDPSFVPDQMDSPGGERVFMNWVGRNPGRVRQLLGIQ